MQNPVMDFPEVEGGIEKAVALAREARWYQLSKADSPPANAVVLIGDRPFQQDWPRGAMAFDWLGEAFANDRPPAEARPQRVVGTGRTS